jgi:hypothetical protein
MPHDCVKAGIIVIQAGRCTFEQKPKAEVPWFNAIKGIEFQESKYGKGRRLFNRAVKKAVNGIGVKEERGWRCTICGVLAN